MFKEAIVRPFLRKSGLDHSELKNYRPVSNLQFVFKLSEKLFQVCVHLRHVFDNSGLMPQLHSACRRLYSTETAVTKVFNDLSQAADTVLCLLCVVPSHSSPSIATCCYSGLNGGGLGCVASYSTGSVHI